MSALPRVCLQQVALSSTAEQPRWDETAAGTGTANIQSGDKGGIIACHRRSGTFLAISSSQSDAVGTGAEGAGKTWFQIIQQGVTVASFQLQTDKYSSDIIAAIPFEAHDVFVLVVAKLQFRWCAVDAVRAVGGRECSLCRHRPE
jgi:hypothetical protein